MLLQSGTRGASLRHEQNQLLRLRGGIPQVHRVFPGSSDLETLRSVGSYSADGPYASLVRGAPGREVREFRDVVFEDVVSVFETNS